MIRWVEGDVSEVAMQVYNPMPFDIKISKMVNGFVVVLYSFISDLKITGNISIESKRSVFPGKK